MSFSLPLSATAAAHRQSLREQLIKLGSTPPDPIAFTQLALTIFRYQATHNPLYTSYLNHLSVRPDTIDSLGQIPFMPISFFRKHTVLTGVDSALLPTNQLLTFASSGTTSQNAGPESTSHHYVPDPALYDVISRSIFEQTYGSLENMHILALLPSYLERNNSSLVYMVQRFMTRSRPLPTNRNGQPSDGFFLNDHAELTRQLTRLLQQSDDNFRILLIGVTFGLLDWAESSPDLHRLGQSDRLIVMETGGMKGRRKELLREEVHHILREKLGVARVHSEYGMTELLSQAYSPGEGIFQPSATLRVLLRDINDPFTIFPPDQPSESRRITGGINVIDLANLDSCAFIETQDLGQYVGTEGAFRVIGRFDNSDVRGCNLMIE